MTGEAQDGGGDALCIDCGVRPQPARKDGEPGTHHRCDPCAKQYLQRRHLRHRLLSGPWSYAAAAEPRRCVECVGDIPRGKGYFNLRPLTEEGWEPVCTPCMAGSGGIRNIVDSAPQAARVKSARLQLHQPPGDDEFAVLVLTPPAMRVLAYLALSLADRLLSDGVPCSITADDSAAAGELAILVSGEADRGVIAQVLNSCGLWLTCYASRVSVPSAHYRAIRAYVYDDTRDIAQAKRLVRWRPPPGMSRRLLI